MNDLKKRIENSFDKACLTYDHNSYLQQKVASNLFGLHENSYDDNPILDIGCGTGYLNEILQEHKISNEIISLDLSSKMCNLVKHKYSSNNIVQADFENLPFKKHSISNIYSSLAIQWCDLNKSLAQINTVLDRNGSLALSTIGEGTLSELKTCSDQMSKSLKIVEFISKDNLQKNLELNGFRNYHLKEEIITISYKDVFSLLTSIKLIGANFKSVTNGKKHYLGKEYFYELNNIYKKSFSVNNKIFASWNIFYVYL